jgi:hypothetical protein
MYREFLEKVGTAITYTNEDRCLSHLHIATPTLLTPSPLTTPPLYIFTYV